MTLSSFSVKLYLYFCLINSWTRYQCQISQSSQWVTLLTSPPLPAPPPQLQIHSNSSPPLRYSLMPISASTIRFPSEAVPRKKKDLNPDCLNCLQRMEIFANLRGPAYFATPIGQFAELRAFYTPSPPFAEFFAVERGTERECRRLSWAGGGRGEGRGKGEQLGILSVLCAGTSNGQRESGYIKLLPITQMVEIYHDWIFSPPPPPSLHPKHQKACLFTTRFSADTMQNYNWRRRLLFHCDSSLLHGTENTPVDMKPSLSWRIFVQNPPKNQILNHLPRRNRMGQKTTSHTTLVKKKSKFPSYIKKFRWNWVQSHNRGRAS